MKLNRIMNVLALVMLVALAVSVSASESQAQSEGVIRRTTDQIMAESALRGPQPVRVKVERSAEFRRFNPNSLDELPVASPDGGLLGFPLPYVSRSPLTPTLSFDAATLSNTNAFPPDTMGAVGPTQYMVTLNGRFRVFDKNTGALGALDVNSDVFFAPVLSPGVEVFTTDPRVRYDVYTQRWYIIMIDVPDSFVDNRIMIAVSDGPTISGGTVWSYYYFQNQLAPNPGDSNCLFDYPTLGLDNNALYIGGNYFCGQFLGFTSTALFVVRKQFVDDSDSNLIDTDGGGSDQAFVRAFRNLATLNQPGAYTPQGVDNLNPNTTVGYVIGVDLFDFSKLVMYRVSNANTANPSLSAPININVPRTSFPNTSPHLGNNLGANGNLDAIDDRLMMAVIRNGTLWTAHAISVNSAGQGRDSGEPGVRNGIRWYQLGNLSGAPTVLQAGTVFDGSSSRPDFYSMPSVNVNGQGHALIGFTAAGRDTAPSAAYVTRFATDPTNTTSAVNIYQAGVGNYNPPNDTGGSAGRRWGDYSFTSIDPCDDMTFWTIQQYNQSLNSYAVRAAKIPAPPPPAVNQGVTLTAGNAAAQASIVGFAPNGEGFHNPNPLRVDLSCAEFLTVTANGLGVTVDEAQVISPTQLLVTFDTTGATPGTSTLTITNPDGQSVNIPLSVQNPVAGNLLTNPGFEDGNAPWTVTNRTKDKRVCNNAVQAPFEGLCYFRFVGVAGEASFLQQVVSRDAFTISAGQALRASAQVKVNGSPQASLVLMVRENGAWVRYRTPILATGGAWQEYTAISSPVVDPNAIGAVRVRVTYNRTSGKMFVDNLSLTVGAP